MITDFHKGEYGTKGKTRWELFDTEIYVGIDDGVTVEYAEKCAEGSSFTSERLRVMGLGVTSIPMMSGIL